MPSSSTSRPPAIASPHDLLARAVERRAVLAQRGDPTAYRLVNGAADGLPGLAIDRYGDLAVGHADSARTLAHWRDLLPAALGLATGYLKVHPVQASRLSEADRATLAPAEPSWGPARDSIEITEHGARYEIRPAAGLSVGLFLDMREVRAWLRHNARARRVLNLFAYTCSFGVCATLGGAGRVLNLDLSRAYLSWGRANYALNGLDAEPRDFVFGDALDWLARFARRGEQFDLVVLDPPSFSSGRRAAFSVARDYPRLAAMAVRVVAPGGILLAATNHAGTSSERFEAWLAAGLDAAGRRGRLAWRWHEPEPDFPVPPGQRPYLKVRAVELL